MMLMVAVLNKERFASQAERFPNRLNTRKQGYGATV
jgi:hypothetical protein